MSGFSAMRAPDSVLAARPLVRLGQSVDHVSHMTERRPPTPRPAALDDALEPPTGRTNQPLSLYQTLLSRFDTLNDRERTDMVELVSCSLTWDPRTGCSCSGSAGASPADELGEDRRWWGAAPRAGGRRAHQS